MRRIAVVGTSGVGKTHLSRRLAEALSIPHVELDALYHQQDWVPLPDDKFRAQVAAAAAEPSWVIDGNYDRFREAVWDRAQVVVVLDYDRWRVMLRLLRRTLRRVLWREELWNGNRERWGNLLSWHPENSILRWAWTTHGPRRNQYDELLADPDQAGVVLVRCATPRDAERWLERILRDDTATHG